MKDRHELTTLLRFGRVAAVNVLAAGLALGVPAQAQTVDEVFEGRARVLEVEVPVNVIDKDGNPLRGLTDDDFKVFES